MNVRTVLREHAAVMRGAVALIPALERVRDALLAAITDGHKILVCGNGGSAAAAQHFVAELVCRFRNDRRPFAAIALGADTATITAIGNDFGYAAVFERQVAALASAGDVLVAISTSGDSPNVVAAARVAHARGCTVLAFTGAGGGALAQLADIAVRVPSNVVARVQEVHVVCIHVLAEALEANALG